MKKEIGILGLGSMGTAIALNLKKKYKVFGYDINWSTLWLVSLSLTIKLMIFFINYNINTICACSSTG